MWFPWRIRGVERVIVYSRPACPLCKKAEASVVRRFGRRHVQTINITIDRALEDRFVLRVPVVVVGGRVVAEGEISSTDLLAIGKALLAANQDSAGSL